MGIITPVQKVAAVLLLGWFAAILLGIRAPLEQYDPRAFKVADALSVLLVGVLALTGGDNFLLASWHHSPFRLQRSRPPGKWEMRILRVIQITVGSLFAIGGIWQLVQALR